MAKTFENNKIKRPIINSAIDLTYREYIYYDIYKMEISSCL